MRRQGSSDDVCRGAVGRYRGLAGAWRVACRGLLLVAAAALPAFGGPPALTGAAAPVGRNLVPNGEFEKQDSRGRLPAGWTTKHPQNVQTVHVGGMRGWVVQMTGDKDLMGTYGADLLSPKIAFRPNTRYRCTGYTKSTGPKMIVFVKGYSTVTRRSHGQMETVEDVVYQMRKEIAPSADWQPFHLDFDIRPVKEFSDFQHRIEHLRITLWAYWPEGTCWYDDIRLEEVGPLPADLRQHEQAVTHTGARPRLAVDNDCCLQFFCYSRRVGSAMRTTPRRFSPPR